MQAPATVGSVLVDDDTVVAGGEETEEHTVLFTIGADRSGSRPPPEGVARRWIGLGDVRPRIRQQLGAVGAPRSSERSRQRIPSSPGSGPPLTPATSGQEP